MLDCARNHVIYFKTASYWYGLLLVSVVNFDRLPLFVKQIGKEIIIKKFWQDASLCFGYHLNTFRMSSHWYHSSSRESKILQWLTYWVCSQMSVRRYSWNSFSENPSYYHAHLNITYIQLFVSRIILVTLLFFFRFTRNTGQARDLPSMVKSLSSFCPKKLQTISLPEDSASRMQRYSLFVLEL